MAAWSRAQHLCRYSRFGRREILPLQRLGPYILSQRQQRPEHERQELLGRQALAAQHVVSAHRVVDHHQFTVVNVDGTSDPRGSLQARGVGCTESDNKMGVSNLHAPSVCSSVLRRWLKCVQGRSSSGTRIAFESLPAPFPRTTTSGAAVLPASGTNSEIRRSSDRQTG
jgi:hypothetical protein